MLWILLAGVLATSKDAQEFVQRRTSGAWSSRGQGQPPATQRSATAASQGGDQQPGRPHISTEALRRAAATKAQKEKAAATASTEKAKEKVPAEKAKGKRTL